MTTKEASEKFKVNEKEIRQSIKDGMMYASKKSGKYDIPNDIKFIPIKRYIQAFLFQILKFKNNKEIALNCSLCSNDEQLQSLMKYLVSKGYIDRYEFNSDIKQLFGTIILTDEGINFAIGNALASKRSKDLNVTLPININIGLVNV